MSAPISVKAYGSKTATSELEFMTVQRRPLGETDIQFEVLFSGVCHSDLHTVRNEWHNTTYDCVPGHEVLGKVTAVGPKVTKFAVGDLAAVGCLVDSCRSCEACGQHEEQFCPKGTFTYNSPETRFEGHTFGGYSDIMVVEQEFALKVPSNLDLAGAAPLLCAGITTYSPLRAAGVKAGMKVGIVGLGGLGHMAVKFAAAMGAEVTLFTTSASKVEDGKRLGATNVVVSKDEAQMAAAAGSLDYILDCVSAQHDVNALLACLKTGGTLCLVGAPENPLPVAAFSVIFGRKKLAGSLIGGIKETAEMLEFCGQHNIVADVEVIPIQDINKAYERMLKSDVKYRFVIDMASIKKEGAQ